MLKYETALSKARQGETVYRRANGPDQILTMTGNKINLFDRRTQRPWGFQKKDMEALDWVVVPVVSTKAKYSAAYYVEAPDGTITKEIFEMGAQPKGAVFISRVKSSDNQNLPEQTFIE